MKQQRKEGWTSDDGRRPKVQGQRAPNPKPEQKMDRSKGMLELQFNGPDTRFQTNEN